MKQINTNVYSVVAINLTSGEEVTINIDTDLSYLVIPYDSTINMNTYLKVSLSLNSVAVGNTITARIYLSNNETKKTLVAAKAVKRVSSDLPLVYFDFTPFLFVRSGMNVFNAIQITLQSNKAAGNDNLIFMAFQVYDIAKQLDIATINGEAPITSDDIADKILVNPANLLKTDVNGNVELSSTTLSSISSNVIDSLASEIGLDASAVKIFKAIASGNVRIKSGTTDTLQYLDTDKQTVLFEAKYSTSGTIKDVTIL